MNNGRLVLVISGLDGGGAARVVTELVADLDRAGYAVTLLTLEGEGKPEVFTVPGHIRRRRIQLMWSTAGLVDRLASGARRLHMLRTALLEDSPEAIISFVDTTNVRVLAATLFSGVPVIVSERTDPRHHKIGKIWNVLRFMFYRRAANVVVQTERVADWMRKRHGSSARIVVIPNAVRGEMGLKHVHREGKMSGCHVVAVGRLVASKGFDALIDAFAQADLPASGGRLTIAGAGPEEARLRAKIDNYHLGNCVTLLGHCDDIPTLLRSADIFVLPSEYEGFPNALLEAMQLGLACISTDCESGPAELIVHGTSGLLVPVGDRPRLAAALRELAFDPAMRKRLGAAAVYVRNTYHPDIITSRWISILPYRSSGHSLFGHKEDPR